MNNINNILFFNDGTTVKLRNKNKIKDIIRLIIVDRKKEIENIVYVFCTDDYLFKMNVKYLHHYTLTDIITFDYSYNNVINGEIFISIDRIRDNSKEFKTTFNKELLRVIFHGALHLIGFKDKSKDEKEIMSQKEDFYLNIFFNSF